MKQAGPRALAFCEKPQGATRIALIFGADPGLVSTSAETLAYNWLPSPDPFNIIKLHDEDLKRDPQMLGDELVARSLMGGERLIRVRVDKDASSKYLLEILADIDKGALTPEAFWIIEAGELNKTNKLRVGFEMSKSAVALQLYADDEAAVCDLVTKRLAAAGVAILDSEHRSPAEQPAEGGRGGVVAARPTDRSAEVADRGVERAAALPHDRPFERPLHHRLADRGHHHRHDHRRHEQGQKHRQQKQPLARSGRPPPASGATWPLVVAVVGQRTEIGRNRKTKLIVFHHGMTSPAVTHRAVAGAQRADGEELHSVRTASPRGAVAPQV